MKQIVTDEAPKAIGSYSQAIVTNGLVFVSGQIPLDPKTGDVVYGGISEQTKRVLENLQAVLAAAGVNLSRVVKTTIYLADLGHFSAVNDIYASYFRDLPPARSTIQAAKLPKSVLIEVDAIASISE